MAKALIGPTGYGTFGVVWRDFPIRARRGGYSGPFKTLDDARRRAEDVAANYNEPLTIEYVDNVNEFDDDEG